MDDKDIIKSLEMLNQAYIHTKESNTYNTGNTVAKFISNIRKGNFLFIISRAIRNRKLRKLESFSPLDNVDSITWVNQLRPGNRSNKVVIYTCITGNYDSPAPPLFTASNIDYIMFTDSHKDVHDSGWIVREIPQIIPQGLSNAQINRYIKMHPDLLFGNDYDYSIYIDGNIVVVSDLSIYCDILCSTVGLGFHSHRNRNCIFTEAERH